MTCIATSKGWQTKVKVLKEIIMNDLLYAVAFFFFYRFLHPLSYRAGVFNLLSSRANLHLSYNPARRSHCRLQNHHGYINNHHRGMGGTPGDVGEVLMT